MARKKMALGGFRNITSSRNKYVFDENDVDVTGGSPEPTISTVQEPESEGPVVMNDKRFADAFKNARVAGLNTFIWKGREYNTRIKGESASSDDNTVSKVNTRTSNTIAVQGRRGTRIRPRTQARTQSKNVSLKRTTARNTDVNKSKTSASTRSVPTKSAPATTPTTTTTKPTVARPAAPATPAPARKVASKAPSDFYEARKMAQTQGKKSFNWKGQTYSSYGATSPVTKSNARHMKLVRR